MDPFHFSCPHCSAPLRVRDKLYVGRQFECPECALPLRIIEVNSGLGVERGSQQTSSLAKQQGPPVGKPPDKHLPPQQSAKSHRQKPPDSSEQPATTRVCSASPPANSPRSSRQRETLLMGGSAATLILLILCAAKLFRFNKDRTEPVANGLQHGAPNAQQSVPANPPDVAQADSQDTEVDDPDTRDPVAGPVLIPEEPEIGDLARPHPADSPAAEDEPLDPEFVPEPAAPFVRKIDLAVSLKQPIIRFDQPRGKPLSEVLTGVAEMAGTRIEFDRNELGPAAGRLAEPVALKLEQTTVGDILAGLLHPAGLTYRIEGEHLRVVPRKAP